MSSSAPGGPRRSNRKRDVVDYSDTKSSLPPPAKKRKTGKEGGKGRKRKDDDDDEHVERSEKTSEDNEADDQESPLDSAAEDDFLLDYTPYLAQPSNSELSGQPTALLEKRSEAAVHLDRNLSSVSNVEKVFEALHAHNHRMSQQEV
ncbi:hypothetical protein LTR36_006499 [Oleoguttula mirabilis]|uniref:Uncharacterized protein n=1 Tax=Oleoguttula mirabilis TaxID=1507867 RepID=A0AAV9JVC9_9PEZI|nr:hypothetical protein LTR36_006499 [Oleoguttula mirabilis]